MSEQLSIENSGSSEDPEPFGLYPIVNNQITLISDNDNYRSHFAVAQPTTVEGIVAEVKRITGLKDGETDKFSYARRKMVSSELEKIETITLTERGVFDERSKEDKRRLEKKDNLTTKDRSLKEFYEDIENRNTVSIDIYPNVIAEAVYDTPITYFVDREETGPVLKRKLLTKVKTPSLEGAAEVSDSYSEDVRIVSDSAALALQGILRALSDR